MDNIKDKIKQGKEVDFKIHDDGSLRYKRRCNIPQKCEELKQNLREEGHNALSSLHPWDDKMYKDLKTLIHQRDNKASEVDSIYLESKLPKISRNAILI